IYNENIRDLLNPSTSQLELREDAKGNHQVAGLSEVEICSSEEVMSLLMRGNKRRTQESTGANKTSSRSHAVLMVQVKKRSPAHSHQQTMRTGRLYMVDLAGSERAAQTQVKRITHLQGVSEFMRQTLSDVRAYYKKRFFV
ncbi:Kinesin-like protein KIF19, partial [Araneus ventricosus]